MLYRIDIIGFPWKCIISQENPVNLLQLPNLPHIMFRNFSSWVLGSLSPKWWMKKGNRGSATGGFHGLRVEVAHITSDSLLLTRTVTQPPQTAETGRCGAAPCPREKRESFGERAVFCYILNPWHWIFLNMILSTSQNRIAKAWLCNTQVEIMKTSETNICYLQLLTKALFRPEFLTHDTADFCCGCCGCCGCCHAHCRMFSCILAPT